MFEDAYCTSQCNETLQAAQLNMGCCFHDLLALNSSLISLDNNGTTNWTQPYYYWQSAELLDSCGLLTEEEEGGEGLVGCGCSKAGRAMCYTLLVALSLAVTLVYSLYLQL